MSTLQSSTLEIPLRLQDSPQDSPVPQTTARPMSSPPKKSVLLATLLSVGCVFIIIICLTWWWKRQRRQRQQASRSPARRSARSQQPRCQPEGQRGVKVVPNSSRSEESSSANLRRARIQNIVPEPQDNHSPRNNNHRSADNNSNHARNNANNDPTSRHSRHTHTRPMDIDVVTLAASSPRLQPLSSVASVIDKYAQLPDNHSRLYSAGGQQYPSSVFNHLAGSSSPHNNPNDHSRDHLHHSPFQESQRVFRDNPLPDHHGLQVHHEFGASPSNRSAGAKVAGREDLSNKVEQLLGPSFGTLNMRIKTGESSIQPKHAKASTSHRRSGYNANTQPARDEPSENYHPTNSAYDITSSYSRSLSDISEGRFGRGVGHDDLQPVPLRILKTKSAQLSGQYNDDLSHGHENLGQCIGTDPRARGNNRLLETGWNSAPGSPDDPTAVELPTEGAQFPGLRVEREDARVPGRHATAIEQLHSNQQELPMSLTLASVRRILGSSGEQCDPLDRHQHCNQGAGEADIKRWRDQVVSDADMEHERRSDETIRLPHVQLTDQADPEHVTRNTHVPDYSFGRHTNETPLPDESGFQDPARDSAASGNSTWTTATPFSFTR